MTLCSVEVLRTSKNAREYLQPYRVAETDQIEEAYRVEGDAYTPFSVLPIVFIYNSKLVYPVAAQRRDERRLIAGKGK